MKTHYFNLHDDGGRVIMFFSCESATYEEAYEKAYKMAVEINSAGITPCDKRGVALTSSPSSKKFLEGEI